MQQTRTGNLIRRVFTLAGLSIATAGVSDTLAAQDKYPSRTVTIVVPFPAGGTTDLLARVFAQRRTETMGQSFVIENVGGGGGSIGAEPVGTSPAELRRFVLEQVEQVRPLITELKLVVQ